MGRWIAFLKRRGWLIVVCLILVLFPCIYCFPLIWHITDLDDYVFQQSLPIYPQAKFVSKTFLYNDNQSGFWALYYRTNDTSQAVYDFYNNINNRSESHFKVIIHDHLGDGYMGENCFIRPTHDSDCFEITILTFDSTMPAYLPDGWLIRGVNPYMHTPEPIPVEGLLGGTVFAIGYYTSEM